jgi:hypothetical protein
VNRRLHPQVEPLAREYARELGEISPSRNLDARIDRLVAAHGEEISTSRAPRPRVVSFQIPRWAAAAALSLLAIGGGVMLGMRLERGASEHVTFLGSSPETAWPAPEMSMWPIDSVALKIPAVYAADGTLVAVDDAARQTSARYWVDIVVSNDGTVRIQNVVPAGTVTPSGNPKDAPTRQIQ